MSQNLVNHIVKSCLSIAGVIGIFLLVMWYQSQPASAHNGGRYLPHDLPACTARILVCDPSSSAFASVKFPANGYPSGRLAFDNSSPKMSTSTSPTGIEQTSFSPQQEPPLQQDELACLDGRGVPQSCNTIAPFQYMPQRLTYEKSTDIDDELVKASNLSALAETPCVDGFADIYPCSHIDLLSFLPLNSLGGSLGSDIWGWTDSASEKEYVLMGLRDGTAFVDISDPVNPVYLGSLPAQNGRSSAWRDIKVYNNHAFIVADGSPGHGMQVFDLTQLRFDLGTTSTFSATAVYTLSASAHNIAINQETGFAYITGSSDGPTRCSGGLHMVDISTPINPTFAGCFSSDGYTHDTQCILYSGPDADYQGQEVCFNSNEDTLTIVDVGQKNSPVQISRKSYEGASYSHQGWLTEDQLYFVQNDESDERNRGYNTTTLIWNVRNLDDPQLIGRHIFPFSSVDHNLYIRNKYIFEANYTTGLRILDASDISNASLYEVAYFDTYPSHNSSTFVSAWSSYPFFESGVVAVSTITEGLFVLRPHLQRATELIKASFFADANYGGAEWAVQVGIYDLPAVLLSPVGNDEISSIEIEPGYEVRACSEGDGNGTCTTYFTSTTELGIMDNQISYVEIVKSEAPNTPPVMINPGPQINTVGDNVTLQLTASDEDGGVLAYSASGLPDGLTVYSTTGQISGTVTTVQTTTITATVEDSQGGRDSVVFSWTVTELPNRPPVLTSPGPQTNRVGDSIALQLTATDEDGDELTYSAMDLPDGLTVYSTTGRISGTVTTVQTASITATVEDSRGGRDSVVFSWTVTELPNTPPVLNSPGPQTNRVGDRVSLQLTATDDDGDELTYSAMGLPDGLTISSPTGQISGMVTTVQTASITATVEDIRGGTDSIVFTWTVNELPNTPPALANPGPQTNRVGDSVTLQLTATDDDGDELTYSAMGLPDGLTISSPTGQISGMVTTV
ncbi:MAG: choice-of-anchor B family protein, partial [Chloroflexota bacterium]